LGETMSVDSLLEEFQKACEAITNEGNGFLNWEWDDRFDTVVATIDAKSQKKILAILKDKFFNSWDVRVLDKAPGNIARIVDLTGGLSKGQMLYASDPRQDVLMIGLWWPWNDGSTTSFRIGLVPQKSQIEQETIDGAMRQWFHV
jgi:hypothetical protein